MSCHYTEPIDNGYCVTIDRYEKYRLRYNVGLCYWPVYREFKIIYTLLKCLQGDETFLLPLDVINYLVFMGFNSCCVKFIKQQTTELYCRPPQWVIINDQIHTATHSLDHYSWSTIEKDSLDRSATLVPYEDAKPLLVPYKFFEADIRHSLIRRLEKEKAHYSHQATLLLRFIHLLSVVFISFWLYRFFYSSQLANICLVLDTTNYKGTCEPIKTRLFIAFVMQFIWFPFAGLLIPFLLLVIHRVITPRRIRKAHTLFKWLLKKKSLFYSFIQWSRR